MYNFGIGTEKNLEKSFEYFEKAANQGHTISQNCLGIMYEDGIGTEKNSEKAFEYHKKSSDQGNIDSQLKLVRMYKDGIGTQKNVKLSVNHLRKIADGGHIESQFELGKLYYFGNGINKNNDLALFYIRKASENRNQEAISFIQTNFMGKIWKKKKRLFSQNIPKNDCDKETQKKDSQLPIMREFNFTKFPASPEWKISKI
jgi:TPR repeat protein